MATPCLASEYGVPEKESFDCARSSDAMDSNRSTITLLMWIEMEWQSLVPSWNNVVGEYLVEAGFYCHNGGVLP